MTGFFAFLAFLVTLALIAVPIILLVMVSNLKSQITMLNQRFLQLYQELKKNTQTIESAKESMVPNKDVSQAVQAFTSVSAINLSDSKSKVEVQPEKQEVIVPEQDTTPEITETVEEPVIELTEEAQTIVAEEIPVSETVIEESVKERVTGQPPLEQKFDRRRQPQPSRQFNFEKFIGENLINKIGIAVLVIGIGLFVKYAIDNEWINEIGRVVIGFLSGGVLLALAYRFRKAYRAFSSVLTGGAMVVFYFTVAIAFREYELFGQAASFLMMVVITAFSVWLSILYDRRELAILSLIGGLLTPFMVSRGDGNYHVLFTYTAILNIGMLTLSLRRQWKELIAISYTGTQLIFWLYYAQNKMYASSHDAALLVYASIFYVIFLLMPLVQVFRNKDKSQDSTLHIILLITNSFIYLLAGILLLDRMGAADSRGLFSAILAAVNTSIALMLYSNNRQNKLLYLLFVGLAISFVTLIAPLQFDGSHITMFWATEALLLLWLFFRSDTSIFYYGSLLLLACSFISLMVDNHMQTDLLSYPVDLNTAGNGLIFLNRYFVTRLYVSLVFAGSGILLRRYHREHSARPWALPGWLSTGLGTVAAALLFHTGYREIYVYADSSIAEYWNMAYTHVFLLALVMLLGRRSKTCQFRFYSALALWSVACIYYWGQASELEYEADLIPILLYWIGFAGLCGLFAVTARIFYERYALKSNQGKTYMWFLNVAAVICLSIALTKGLDQINISFSNKAAITVLWSLFAFVQMWLGMHLKYKTLRIISLSLLGLVLCKLFLFDLQNVSQGAKIVAFVVLGIVLLVLSFLYQKLKKILFEDDENN